MKRIKTLLLCLAMATLAAGQTPTVVEKSGSSAAKPKTGPQATSMNRKPSPAGVKVVAAPSQKTSGSTAKPASVPVQAGAAKPVVVSAAKSNVASPAKAAQTTTKAPAKAVSVQSVAAMTTSGKSQAKTAAVSTAKPAANTAAKVAPASSAKDPFSGKKKVDAVQVKTVSAAPAKTAAKSGAASADAAPPAPRKIGAAGRRDPFVSPVVSMSAVGSGCSSGKRCLSIEQISLRGVVRSDTGMIAVVVNALDKAYFLRENDPVFNGFVEKITADSIVFKQTFHDKLGKPLTRDVTKTITRPAA
jgi:hypothetical protein